MCRSGVNAGICLDRTGAITAKSGPLQDETNAKSVGIDTDFEERKSGLDVKPGCGLLGSIPAVADSTLVSTTTGCAELAAVPMDASGLDEARLAVSVMRQVACAAKLFRWVGTDMQA